jgi:hypothetical protein
MRRQQQQQQSELCVTTAAGTRAVVMGEAHDTAFSSNASSAHLISRAPGELVEVRACQ